MISVVALYALLASSFTLAKVVLYYAKPCFIIGMRMVLAGGLLLGYLRLFAPKALGFSRNDLGLLAQTVLFHVYIAYVFEFWALQAVTSSKACLLYNLSPFITALFAYVLMNERLTSRKWLGLSLGMLGMLPALIASAPSESSMLSFLSMQEVVLLIAVASAAYGWILMSALVRKRSYSPIAVNGYAMLGGGVLSFLTSYMFEGAPTITGTDHATVVWGRELLSGFMQAQSADIVMFFVYLGLLILFTNVIFYNLYGYLLKRYSATFLSFAGFTCPLFAALYGWLFLSEAVTIWFFASVAIVVIGLYVFYQEELKQGMLTKRDA